MNDIEDAVEFFDEYKQVASNDNTQYILEYKIARAKNASLNEQIKILEEYKDRRVYKKNGLMNWQPFTIKPGIKKDVLICVMRLFCGSARANM